MMPKLPEPDAWMLSDTARPFDKPWPTRVDSEAYRLASVRSDFKCAQLFEESSVRAIQEEAYKAGMAAAVPDELMALFNFMCAAFVPMTGQQDQIKIQLDLAKKAMAAREVK